MELNKYDFDVLNDIVKMLMSKFECSMYHKEHKAKELKMIIRKLKRVK